MRNRKNSLFLLEMMFVILLFAVCGAVCLQMFGYGSQVAKEARDLSQATLVARSGADSFQATQGDVDKTAEILGGSVTGNGILVCYPEDGLEMTMVISDETALITVINPEKQEEIFAITAKIPKGVGP